MTADRSRSPIRAGIASASLLLLVGGLALAAEETPQFSETQRAHWAWKRPAPPLLPKVQYAAWVRNPIDAFILAKQEAKGLKPAPTASREELIRRVALDLTGLPPTLEEIDAFLADRAPDAYERMVDRYLASPRYGERWARHWLDLARYADSNGYEHDEIRPEMWRYRDYVVRAFNDDRPYDRFIMEQLAGDEIAPDDPEARIATGFNLLGPDMTDSADQAARRQNTLNDMTDTAASVFLGLTLQCARCHDHKFEPLTQKDYYRFQAFFVAAQFRKDIPVGRAAELEAFERARAEHAGKVGALKQQVEALAGPVLAELRAAKVSRLPEDVRTAFRTSEKERTVEQQQIVARNTALAEPAPREVTERLPEAQRGAYDDLARRLRELEAGRPVPPMAMALDEGVRVAPQTFVLGRGELSNREEEVQPGAPVILSSLRMPETLPTTSSTGRRTALARWIASPENPLTARVLVNRVWQHHFGRGLVPTPSDFGVRGESPTHGELLDYLAGRFAGRWDDNLPPQRPTPDAQRPAWSLKSLHRLILTSNAYKQSSHASATAMAGDPENLLFSRMPRQRLEAEAVRDAALFVSGRLNEKRGGPGVFPPLPAGAQPNPGVWPVTKDPTEHTRRSLYIFVRRNLHVPALEVFDSPDTNLSCPRREVTTTAPQALAMLNGPEMVACGRALAGRVLAGAAGEEEQIALAYRLTLGRRPTPGQLALAREFLTKQAGLLKGRGERELLLPEPLPAGVEKRHGAAMTDFCLALLNLNEFVYVD
jgi:hypothetical protein